MRLLPIIKELPIPAILGTGIYAGVTGDLPLAGSATDLPLTNLDIWVFENTKHPALFLTFSGLTLAWIIYVVSRLIIYGRRENALVKLGETWERATHLLNDLARNPILSSDDCKKICEIEDEIYGSVEVISPGEVSTFRTLGTINPSKHPPKYQEALRGDRTLLILSERLRRVREFIDKHSPPEQH